MTRTEEDSDRDRIREILTQNIETLNERVEKAWRQGVDADEEGMQLRRLETIAHLARQFRLLARDTDLEEMESGVELIEAAMDVKGDR